MNEYAEDNYAQSVWIAAGKTGGTWTRDTMVHNALLEPHETLTPRVRYTSREELKRWNGRAVQGLGLEGPGALAVAHLDMREAGRTLEEALETRWPDEFDPKGPVVLYAMRATHPERTCMSTAQLAHYEPPWMTVDRAPCWRSHDEREIQIFCARVGQPSAAGPPLHVTAHPLDAMAVAAVEAAPESTVLAVPNWRSAQIVREHAAKHHLTVVSHGLPKAEGAERMWHNPLRQLREESETRRYPKGRDVSEHLLLRVREENLKRLAHAEEHADAEARNDALAKAWTQVRSTWAKEVEPAA